MIGVQELRSWDLFSLPPVIVYDLQLLFATPWKHCDCKKPNVQRPRLSKPHPCAHAACACKKHRGRSIYRCLNWLKAELGLSHRAGSPVMFQAYL